MRSTRWNPSSTHAMPERSRFLSRPSGRFSTDGSGTQACRKERRRMCQGSAKVGTSPHLTSPHVYSIPECEEIRVARREAKLSDGNWKRYDVLRTQHRTDIATWRGFCMRDEELARKPCPTVACVHVSLTAGHLPPELLQVDCVDQDSAHVPCKWESQNRHDMAEVTGLALFQ